MFILNDIKDLLVDRLTDQDEFAEEIISDIKLINKSLNKIDLTKEDKERLKQLIEEQIETYEYYKNNL